MLNSRAIQADLALAPSTALSNCRHLDLQLAFEVEDLKKSVETWKGRLGTTEAARDRLKRESTGCALLRETSL